MAIVLALHFLSSEGQKPEKKALVTFAMAALGCAFLVNTACGIQHKKMRARGGTLSSEEGEKFFYFANIPMNFLLAVMAFAAAFRTWYDHVPIRL
jgi:hypothetical protein